MPFVVRYMGHQLELTADTRLGPRVFPRGMAVSVRGGDGQQLLRQQNLQFERVRADDPDYANPIELDALNRPAPEPEP